MLKPSSYVEYLETLALSLLNEHGSSDVRVTDPLAPPPLKGFSISPLNAREEIAKQRASREERSGGGLLGAPAKAQPARSIVEFLERLEALAYFHLPLQPGESHHGSGHSTQYYRLEFDGFAESPWVTVSEHADSITATISGDESRTLLTPEDAFEALKGDCRARLTDAGLEPAF